MPPADLEAPAHRRTPFGQYQRASIADLPEPYLARLARQGFPQGVVSWQGARRKPRSTLQRSPSGSP